VLSNEEKYESQYVEYSLAGHKYSHATLWYQDAVAKLVVDEMLLYA